MESDLLRLAQISENFGVYGYLESSIGTVLDIGLAGGNVNSLAVPLYAVEVTPGIFPLRNEGEALVLPILTNLIIEAQECASSEAITSHDDELILAVDPHITKFVFVVEALDLGGLDF